MEHTHVRVEARFGQNLKKFDLKKVAGSGWNLAAQDWNRWRSLGKDYIQQGTGNDLIITIIYTFSLTFRNISICDQ